MLMRRIERAYDDFTDTLSGYDARQIIAEATTIAATRDAYEYLSGYYSFDNETLIYLLQFENPLAVVADVYCNYIVEDFYNDYTRVMHGIRHDNLAPLSNYDLAHPNCSEYKNNAPIYLPPICYDIAPETGNLIIITSGVTGFQIADMNTRYAETNRQIVDCCNNWQDVTPAQREAMRYGAHTGKWDTPLADPRNYREDGTPKKPSEWILPAAPKTPKRNKPDRGL